MNKTNEAPVYQKASSGMSLTDRVTEALMEKISKRELPPNCRLPTEKALSQRFGVSRSVIREAMSRLKSRGLVVTKQGSGAFVRKATPEIPIAIIPDGSDFLQSTLDVIELRKVLESETAALAAIRRTGKDLAKIRKAFSEIDKALASGGDANAEDLAFNMAIANAAKNPVFSQVHKFVRQYIYYDAIMRLMRNHLSEFNDARQAEHAAILKAIERRDPKAAREAVCEHLQNATMHIKEAESQFWIGLDNKVVKATEPSVKPASKRSHPEKRHISKEE